MLSDDVSRISGTTRRYVVKTARLAREVFITEFDGYPLAAGHLGSLTPSDLVDEFRFSRQPSSDVVLIYRRTWGMASDIDRLAVSAFAGNLAADAKPEPPDTIDASQFEPLPDAEFWPLIDMLGGNMWENSIGRVSTHLSALSDEFILRFAQAGARKMWELDSPLICVAATGKDGAHYLDGGWSEHLRGAAIAAGRETFERAIDAPTSMLDLRLSNLSWAIPLIPAQAWRKKHGDAFLTTAWDRKPGSNRSRWDAESRPVVGPGERWDPWTDEDESQSQVRLREIYAKSGIPSEPPYYGDDGVWWASRALITSAGSIYECLVLSIVLNGQDGWESTAQSFQLVADSMNGAIISPVERRDIHTRHLLGGAVFWIKRRSSLETDAYKKAFIPGS